MKVYELMNVLAGMPAGAEVKGSQVLTLGDLAGKEVVGVEDGFEIYRLTREVVEVIEVNKNNVYLYTD